MLLLPHPFKPHNPAFGAKHPTKTTDACWFEYKCTLPLSIKYSAVARYNQGHVTNQFSMNGSKASYIN